MNKTQLTAEIGAGILSIAAFVSEMPSELQKQIEQPFPDSIRGYLGIVFATCGYIAHRYAARQHINDAIAAAALPLPPMDSGIISGNQIPDGKTIPVAYVPTQPAAQPPKP